MYYIGIDLGGTNIAAGLVDDSGKIICDKSIPTGAERNYTEIVKDMAELSKEIIVKSGVSIEDVKAVGIGSPGSIDNKNGICTYSNNINMENANISGEFKKYLDLPVNLENDANAAAYGEYTINGNDVESFVFVTLGTGVGGGVVLDGEIYRGFNGVGAEIGHTVVDMDGEQCTCGRKGCWEAYASVTALIRQTKKAMAENPDSKMHEIAEKEGKVSGRTAFDAAKCGDKAAETVVNKYFEYVAEGITNMVNIFQPNKIIIGGSISKEGDYLLKPIREYVEKNDYNRHMEKVQIEIATLFGDAGIIGAALAAKRKICG
ncbi:MAG: ROK family protein [Firmicutes bacterium]|nr:ROK family protein [Bacillota bacterium]